MSPQENQNQAGAAHQQAPQTNPAAEPQQAPVQPPLAQQTPPGSIAQAWTDITGHSGWFPRVLLLMFMGAVPFLNFFVAGYLLKWATKTSNTQSEGLPRHTFDGECFVWGFLFSVLQFIVTIATIFISIFLNIIPVIGFIFAWLLSIFFTGYIYLAGIRMVMKKKFGSGFDLSQIFEVIKRDPWHFFLAVFLPTLAVAAVIAIILILIWVIFLSSNVTNFLKLFSGASGYSSSALNSYGSSTRGYGSSSYSSFDPLSIILGIVTTGGVTFLISLLIAGIVGTFGNIWVVRAVAHWLRKTAPEWFEGRDVPYIEKPVAPAAPVPPAPPAGPANSASPAGKAPSEQAENAAQAAPAASKKPAEK